MYTQTESYPVIDQVFTAVTNSVRDLETDGFSKHLPEMIGHLHNLASCMYCVTGHRGDEQERERGMRPLYLDAQATTPMVGCTVTLTFHVLASHSPRLPPNTPTFPLLLLGERLHTIHA